jgi:hypothetical protein
MSPDQHYCVECGNRRGKPRFSLENNKKATAPAPPPPSAKTRSLSSGATLLLGLLVLMLALWTGVQLGNKGGSNPAADQKPAKITINNTGGGGSGGASTTPTSNSSNSNGSSSSKTAQTPKGKPDKQKASKAQQKAALSGQQQPDVNIHNLHTKKQKKAAATKVQNQTQQLGNGKTEASQKTTIGSKCNDNEVGCTNGKYTGSYFGSGGG